jgi:hypothetical protein
MNWKVATRNFFLIIFGVMIIFGTILFLDYQKDILSITFWTVIIGTSLLLLLLWPRFNDLVLKWIFGDIVRLKCDVLSNYYSKMIDAIGMLISAFIVGLAILWGLSKDIDYNELHKQTLLLVVFLIYAVTVLISTIGQSLKNQINVKCMENKG